LSAAKPAGEDPPSSTGGRSWREARFRHTASFPDVLRRLGCTLLVSTYQAGKLIAIGADDSGLRFNLHQFDQAMGVAANRTTIVVGARGQIWFLRDNSRLAPLIEPRGTYDRCYLPRTVTVTGSIQCHELAWGEDDDGSPDLWVVNTRFSCLAGLDPEYSFVPRWRPPFISGLAGEDRCHLNGVGMRDGRPAFVTAMSQTDEPGGWRADKNRTGCVLEVPSGETVTTGMAMPHSPRWHDGRLLVLNSGWGTLETVEPGTGHRVVIERLPGFTRGLACHGGLAFIGLSRVRETAVFGGLPISERHTELKCGVGVVDLRSGETIATLEFESGIEEIFDVQVLPGTQQVAFGGGERADGQDVGEIWVVPPQDEQQALTSAQVDGLLVRALAAQRERRTAEALALFRRAAAARPDSAEIANQLGNALQDADQQEQALEQYRRAVATDPGFVPGLQNLGYLLVSQGLTDEGLEHLRRAQEAEPRDLNRVLIATALPVIYASIDDAAVRRQRLEDQVRELAESEVRIDTSDTLIPTNFFAAYHGQDDRALHANLGRIFIGPDLAAVPPGDRPSGAGGRARIGLISAYFRDHTIGRLNLGRVQHLDRERFEVVVLSASASRDPIALAFEQAADRFVSLPREPGPARQLVVEQQLDLLLFCDVGMDALTYTLAFSRMAPVQCATWGHPVTTGSPSIDYFVSSELLETADADAHYIERLVRLPSLATSYPRVEPGPGADRLRTELGLDEAANVYGCPQTLFKLHPSFDPLLAEILRRDPDGVLVLIEGRMPTWTRLLRERLARTMPDVVDRIRWLAPLPRERFLALLAATDVLLDPITFGGGNTSYEALGVGTPVVTLPGELMRTRITRALYAKAGYMELVADSADEYVETAVRLGTDAVARDGARARIRESCGVLFEDPAEIRDLDAFVAEAVKAA
jgi:protein O-GlcNAc transferase